MSDPTDSAHDIADQFIRQVEKNNQTLGLRPVDIYAFALLRACKEIQVYRASDTALDTWMRARPGQMPQDAAQWTEAPAHTNPPERSGTPESERPVRRVSGESSVKCPNCSVDNEINPSPYLRYLCFNCGYTETAL